MLYMLEPHESARMACTQELCEKSVPERVAAAAGRTGASRAPPPAQPAAGVHAGANMAAYPGHGLCGVVGKPAKKTGDQQGHDRGQVRAPGGKGALHLQPPPAPDPVGAVPGFKRVRRLAPK